MIKVQAIIKAVIFSSIILLVTILFLPILKHTEKKHGICSC